MGEISTIGLDLAKTVFQAHGADATGGVVLRKKLRRDQLLAFFAGQTRCVVAMEACARAHYWAREIGALGHETKLIPPASMRRVLLALEPWLTRWPPAAAGLKP